jgi:hypothetical protein
MEVKVMTDNFGKKIEGNGLGIMYHGKLQTGQEVAVKVWAGRLHSAAKEFQEFVKFCGEYERCCEHIVKVIGYCEEGDQQISIYEYMPGGTLQDLHDKGVLDWKTRLQIALHIAQGQQYFGLQYPTLWRDTIFLTKNWVPKSILIQSQATDEPGYVIYNFGRILWELISRQPQPRYGKGLNHMVKIISEDFGNMGISNPTLGSNYPKEAIEKIAKLIRVSQIGIRQQLGVPQLTMSELIYVSQIGIRQQLGVPQLTMSDVIDEINGALQLEEGKKAEEGVIKIEIPQYASK